MAERRSTRSLAARREEETVEREGRDGNAQCIEYSEIPAKEVTLLTYYFQTMRRRLDIKHVRDGVMQQLCALYSRIYHNRRGTKSPGDGFLARPSLCSRITRLRCWGIGGGCTDRAWVMRQ